MRPKLFLSCLFLAIFSFQVSFPVIAALALNHHQINNSTEEVNITCDNWDMQLNESEVLSDAFDLLAESNEKGNSEEEGDFNFLISFRLVRVLYSFFSFFTNSLPSDYGISHKLEGLPAFLANRVLRI